MRRLLPKHLLLILTLVFGQWLAVAHAHEHAALSVDQVCQICLHAPGIDTGALGGKPAFLPAAPSSEAPGYLPPPATARTHHRLTRIRGPPAVTR
ncbi:MAG: hypothetical protein ACPHN2_06725 [Sinimarinibacterium flocculans]|uniref:hypothetical protein n=1 Tax=Sinimarinibacterium flocculans TaxID=985250 RepID=UPI003C421156